VEYMIRHCLSHVGFDQYIDIGAVWRRGSVVSRMNEVTLR